MRLFISYAYGDSEMAADLESVLHSAGIEVWSRRPAYSREEWYQIVDREGAKADGFVFLFGPGFSVYDELRAEWRWFLRHDWDGKKPLVPVVTENATVSKDVAPFLRSRKPLVTAHFYKIVDDLKRFVEHPEEGIDHSHDEERRAENLRRRKELQDWADARREEAYGGKAKA